MRPNEIARSSIYSRGVLAVRRESGVFPFAIRRVEPCGSCYWKPSDRRVWRRNVNSNRGCSVLTSQARLDTVMMANRRKSYASSYRPRYKELLWCYQGKDLNDRWMTGREFWYVQFAWELSNSRFYQRCHGEISAFTAALERQLGTRPAIVYTLNAFLRAEI